MLTRKDVDAWNNWARKAYEPLARAPETDTDAHDPRIAHASEYAAYQLGEINRKLDILIELLARREARRQ
jgi:hypothetical protein